MLRDIILALYFYFSIFYKIPVDLVGKIFIVFDTSDVMVSMEVCVKTTTLSIQ